MTAAQSSAAGGPSSTVPMVASTVTAPAASTEKPFSFHDLLSELNPLQYLPVIGTIYRSVTGDVIPETVRTVGSIAVSAAIGGPIGLATGVGALLLEKVTGLDPETIGHDLLAQLGIGASGNAASVPAASPAAAPTIAAAAPSGAVAWSQAQLAAYGVTTNDAGQLRQGELEGSDVLNDLELQRHAMGPTAPPAAV